MKSKPNNWENNSDKEEWGGWKIVSDMLDCPDNLGIYPTSQCYQSLYEFVVEQKNKARKSQKEDTIKECIELSDKLEMEYPTEFNEWRAFKRFRNKLRDILNELK